MHVDIDDRLMTWTLDRPEQSNGLDEATMDDMTSALDRLEEAGNGIVCLLIGGDQTVFSTGLDQDLLEACFHDPERFAVVVERSRLIFDRIEMLPMVTIACVDGECRLGGVELALCCDLIVAGKDARFCDGHLAYEALPGGGGTKRLPQRLGYSAALRFILEAPVLDAGQAAQWGLVDEVTGAGKANQRGAEIAASLRAHEPSLIYDIKASLRAASPVNAPPAQAGGFRVRLKAIRSAIRRTSKPAST